MNTPFVHQAAGDVIHLVQITDCHLMAEPGGTLLKMDTDHSLQAVIDCVKAERRDIDLVLATGDLSDGGSVAAYQRFNEYITQITAPALWLPGNHDHSDNMRLAAPAQHTLCGEARIGRWQIIMLNSQIPGEIGGRLGAAELNRLQQALAAAQQENLYSLICMHHQPVPVGCAWLDEQKIADADALLALIEEYSGARAMLWGHVHQAFDHQHQGVRLLATPSSCVQFAPGQVDFKADDAAPGYRWLDLYSDGRIETGVSRVEDVEFTVDLETGGYL